MFSTDRIESKYYMCFKTSLKAGQFAASKITNLC
jgi:hypothetical protein